MKSSSCPPSRFVRVSAILWLSFCAASSAFAQPVPRQPPPADPLVRMNESIDALTKKVWPSVVQILVSSYGPQERARRAAPRRHRPAAVRLVPGS